ncbi:MAG: gamma-glutamyltransferase [Pseudomonadota bacterium]
MKTIYQGALVLLLGVVASVAMAASPQPVRSTQGMVVSASDLVSAIGADILAEGGNAVDAAVAVGFGLAVTFPSAGNLGGGGFMVIYRASDRHATTIDYRETAPGAATENMYLDANDNVVEGASTDGHGSVAVPGTVAGLLYVLEQYGSMSRRQVMAPAIRLASRGFEVNWHLQESLKRSEERLSLHPESRRLYLRDGNFYRVGEKLKQPELATTLRRISREGADAFYRGTIADQIVAEMQAGGGLVSLQDLADYRVVERAPVRGTYRDYVILSMPPPSSGGTVLVQMLNMMEPLDVAALGMLSSGYVHNAAEVMKRAFADRAEFMGDPAFVDVPVKGLTAKAYAMERRASISPDSTIAARDLGAGKPLPFESPETTHFSIVDREGNAVSNTYTLNYSYGSGVTVRGAGFLLNNIMDNFAAKQGVPNGYGLIQGPANVIAPGKRPLSSMSPSIVLEGDEVRLVAGTPGGPTIINTVFQVIMNVLDFGMNAQQAVNNPRFHHQWLPDEIQYEADALVVDVQQALTQKGHALKERGLIGDAQVIYIDPATGERQGGADPRRGGAAVGN